MFIPIIERNSAKTSQNATTIDVMDLWEGHSTLSDPEKLGFFI